MSRARRLVAVLLAALAGCLALTAPAGAARPPHSGNLPAALLTSISCTGTGNCWAVGTGTPREHPVIDHWNGSAWAPVAAPVPRGSTGMWAVSCINLVLCWAVGTGGPSHTRPFAERWNGTKWSLVPLPAFPGPSLAVSDDVWCSSAASCWVLEDGGPAEFEHWNGRAWTVVTVPAFGRRDRFDRVTCASDDDCWVTGSQGTGGTISGHWDGRAWTAVPTPTAHAPGDKLLGISCPGVSCLAVGATDDPYNPLAERWNGSAWRVTPIAVPNAELAGVSCATARYCLAVGVHTNLGGRALSERWNGSGWRAVPVPAPQGSSSSLLTAVDCVTTTDCWAVGSDKQGQAEPSLIEHWNGTAWSIVN